jgi:diguanylate cyclase (GGDEF)-like protein
MLGKKDEGLRLARASMVVDERAGQPAEVASTQDELGHYLEKAGHFADAYAAYSGYRRLAEQVFRSDLQRNLSELQESFDHERRRRELELLERENRLQHSQLVSRELQQWLWITGALLGALLLALGSLLLRRLRAGNLELEQTNAQLEQLSERDVLTGLSNRRGFQAAMQSCTRIDGTLMLVDVDHFKQINDRWGHAAGDVVLVELARRLRSALRDDDLIVRWGGEEFLLWVPATPRAEAEALVARTLAAISSEPVPIGADRIRVTASIGFATFPIAPACLLLNWEQALELIDTSMYLAKSHGRNRAYGVRSANAANAADLSKLARSFETAWRDGQVELVAINGSPTPMKAAA